MRRQNLALVMREVAARGPLSRADVAAGTGLTRAAVSSLVEELRGSGLLTELGPAPSGRVGRPGTALMVGDRGPAGLGLEVGVDHVGACVVDLRGAVRAWAHLDVANRGRPAAQTLADLARVAECAVREAADHDLYPVGAVLSVPGLVGAIAGSVEHAPNLGWRAQPVAVLLPGWLRTLPLTIENEANLGALAELWHGDDPTGDTAGKATEGGSENATDRAAKHAATRTNDNAPAPTSNNAAGHVSENETGHASNNATDRSGDSATGHASNNATDRSGDSATGHASNNATDRAGNNEPGHATKHAAARTSDNATDDPIRPRPGAPTDFIYVSVQAGIGAALVADGRLFRGARGFAGELGHVPVHPDGPACPCGARGCLEQYAGEAAILAAAGAGAGSVGGDPTEALARRAASGEVPVLAALDRAGAALGTALAGAVNLIDPAAIVLGGAATELAAWLLPPMRRELNSRVTVRPWSPEALTASRLGRRGPLLGAATSTVRRIIEDPAGAAPAVPLVVPPGG
jgi:predicted NBD/HSP70 family sugar kinase